jgi:hypothetical protein
MPDLPVRDLKGGELPGAKGPANVQLDHGNYMLFATKFLEEIRDEFRKLNATLERMEKNG